MMRAEAFVILRRVPLPGYDISFLITNFHTEALQKNKLVDFIVEFMEQVDKLSIIPQSERVVDGWDADASPSDALGCCGRTPSHRSAVYDHILTPVPRRRSPRSSSLSTHGHVSSQRGA